MKKRIVFFIFIGLLSNGLNAQSNVVDSMLRWIAGHSKIDSQYILTLHRISFRTIDKDLKQSFAYYEKVSYYSDSLNFSYGKALAQINLGLLYSKSANFYASNNAYFKAIEYAEAHGGLRLKAVSLNNIGDNFKILDDNAKCRQYTTEAIAINSQLQAWRGVAINYELLMRCDLDDKLYDSARSNMLRGMEASHLANDTTLYPMFYLGFGKWYAFNNQPDSAAFYFDKAIHDAKLNLDPANVFAGYIAKAQYLQNIKPDEKLQLLKKAMQIARDPKDLDRVSDAAHQLFIAYDERKNKDSSLAYYRIYHAAADSLFSYNNRRNVAIKETEWMVKRKEIENTHLKELAKLQDKDLAVKNILLAAIGISLLLSIIIAFVVYKSVQNKKKITESKLQQSVAETQMQVLRSQMNPHFIFNCLNSIDAYIQSNDKYNATLYLNKFARLIRNLLDSSKQNFVTFSKDAETLKLYIELELQRSENKFTVDTKIDDELMTSDYKVPPLIIQPFVENAIIHGLRNRDDNRGALCINISKTDQHILYTITDNGIGRSAAARINAAKGNSYGLEMTLDRVRLFNKEAVPSVEINDLYENGRAAGTKVQVQLNIV